jgi:hypothetical protein
VRHSIPANTGYESVLAGIMVSQCSFDHVST